VVSNVLPAFSIKAGELLQHVSRVWYRDKSLHYGRIGMNRYDAPDRNYGVLYLGLDLPTALMESVFHTHEWHRDTERSMKRKKQTRPSSPRGAMIALDVSIDDTVSIK
jgi:hypothetical protein